MRVFVHFSFLLLLLIAGLAQAQAPVEDRKPRLDPLLESQQRVDFARQASDQAEQRVRQAERDALQDETAFKAVQKQADEARAVSEKSKKNLADTRARAVEAKRAYDKESAEFTRLRRQTSEPAKKG
jgi:uncharacterized protein YPO0396